MITKIYFPRVILPLSSILASLVDFFVALPILIVMMIIYGYHINIYILLIPYYLLLTVITSFGVSLWFSAMDAGLSKHDIAYFLKAYFQQDLKTIFRQHGSFLKAVDKTARRLYRKDHRHDPPESTVFS